MFQLGEIQTLEIVKRTEFGVYLSPENSEQKVLLPLKQVPEHCEDGDLIEVFLYKDSEDRLIATTQIPPITMGKLAVLDVKEISKIGAFLDWGLAKDLLLPFKEQTYKVQAGDQVLVALYADKSDRLCATMRVYDYLTTNSPYQKDDMVKGRVYEIIESFGAFVAVDNMYSGLIPTKEMFRPFKVGEVIEGRVTSVKEDGKLNLSVREKAHVSIDQDAEVIYDKLIKANGFLPYHDKSDAEEIKEAFHLSKNAFKRAVGRLLKENKIELTAQGIKKK